MPRLESKGPSQEFHERSMKCGKYDKKQESCTHGQMPHPAVARLIPRVSLGMSLDSPHPDKKQQRERMRHIYLGIRQKQNYGMNCVTHKK